MFSSLCGSEYYTFCASVVLNIHFASVISTYYVGVCIRYRRCVNLRELLHCTLIGARVCLTSVHVCMLDINGECICTCVSGSKGVKGPVV
jgi:hypothetical protein